MSPNALPARYPGLQGLSLMAPSELDFMVAAVPPSAYVLELGTYSGTSAAELLRRRPDVRALCVDVMQPDTTHYPSTSAERLGHWLHNKLAVEGLYGDRMTLLLAPMAAAQRLVAGPFDAAVVDADHRFDPTLAALYWVASLLPVRSPIFVHDYGHADWPDVTAAVDAFCCDGWAVSSRSGSLAVLNKE